MTFFGARAAAGAAVLAFVLSAAPAHAAFILASAQLDPGVNTFDSPVIDNNVLQTAGTVSASVSLESSFGSSSFVGEAYATTTYNQSTAYVSVDLTNYLPQSYESICGPSTICGPGGLSTPLLPGQTTNIVSDVLHFSGRSGVGFLAVIFLVDGETSLTSTVATDLENWGPPVAQGQITLFRGEYGSGSTTLINSWGFHGDAAFISALVPFNFADPLALSYVVQTFIDSADFITPGNPYNLSGVADFAHTFSLGALSFYADAEGTQLISDFTVTSDSGTVYNVTQAPPPPPPPDPVAVAEPASGLLLALAFGLLAFRRPRPIRVSA